MNATAVCVLPLEQWRRSGSTCGNSAPQVVRFEPEKSGQSQTGRRITALPTRREIGARRTAARHDATSTSTSPIGNPPVVCILTTRAALGVSRGYWQRIRAARLSNLLMFVMVSLMIARCRMSPARKASLEMTTALAITLDAGKRGDENSDNASTCSITTLSECLSTCRREGNQSPL